MVIARDEREARVAIGLGAVEHVVRSGSRSPQAGLESLLSFASRSPRRLLIVEDDATQRMALADLLGGRDLEILTAEDGARAIELTATGPLDCIVMDLGLPDMRGVDVIRELRSRSDGALPPIIIYTGRELRPEDRAELSQVSNEIVVKDANSPERLLALTVHLLHRPEENLPEAKRKLLREMDRRDPLLVGKRMLIVDDDMRNIFALSTVLERFGMQVAYAENGQDGIDRLRSGPPIDVVLMDIMMPGMDGYQTIRAIREDDRLSPVPIVALTALAMPGDRERCIEAGASDYVTKPVNVQHLMAVLRVHLIAGILQPAATV